MRLGAKKIFGIVLPMLVLLIASHGLAHEPSQGDQNSVAESNVSAPAPDLADVIPLATELSGRLAILKNQVTGLPDVSSFERKYTEIDANMKSPAGQLKQLKDSKVYNYNKLVDLREAIEKENKLFEKISKPIHQAVRKLGAWRKEWLAEKKRWHEWESSLLKEGALDQLKSTFERANDTIEIDGKWAEIKRIGLRATTVQTFDQADVIIPNADLVANQVTNWTLSNRRVRLTVPVGVAYGSDVPLVMEKLTECANENAMVVKTPAPQVLFLSFGESSLDFELRVWVLDADHRLKVKSELHQEIDRRFREAEIEIAFPQRDLHLRSVDESVILRPPETTR